MNEVPTAIILLKEKDICLGVIPGRTMLMFMGMLSLFMFNQFVFQFLYACSVLFYAFIEILSLKMATFLCIHINGDQNA